MRDILQQEKDKPTITGFISIPPQYRALLVQHVDEISALGGHFDRIDRSHEHFLASEEIRKEIEDKYGVSDLYKKPVYLGDQGVEILFNESGSGTLFDKGAFKTLISRLKEILPPGGIEKIDLTFAGELTASKALLKDFHDKKTRVDDGEISPMMRLLQKIREEEAKDPLELFYATGQHTCELSHRLPTGIDASYTLEQEADSHGKAMVCGICSWEDDSYIPITDAQLAQMTRFIVQMRDHAVALSNQTGPVQQR